MPKYSLYTGADLVGHYSADELANVIGVLTQDAGEVTLRIVVVTA